MSGSRLFTSAKHDASGEHTAPVVLPESAPSLAQQLRLFFKYGRTDTTTGVHQPEQLLQRVRLLFLCFLGVTLVPHLLAPIVGNQQHNSVHIAASGAILVLLWWWLLGYRRQHLPVLSCVAEAAGLLLVLAATNQPSATLERTGFDPHLLKLEITESVAMADVASTATTLHVLKHVGIQLAVDDFGTGYSAMSYLRHFSVDTLKIDQTFIRGLSNQAADLGIVQAVIAFSQTLKLDVTAEGIETVEQLNHLRASRCERGQGYYFAKPLPGDEFGELLANEYLEHLPVTT